MLLTTSWPLISIVRPKPFVWLDHPLMVHFSLYILVFFSISMSPCPSMTSQWMSFRHSTLPLRNFIPTYGPPFKSFGSCVTCFVSALLLPPSCAITHRTHPTRLAGYPLSADRVVFSLPPSQLLTKILRENSLKFPSS